MAQPSKLQKIWNNYTPAEKAEIEREAEKAAFVSIKRESLLKAEREGQKNVEDKLDLS